MIMVEKKKDIGEPRELTLTRMVKDGLLEERWDGKIKDFTYKLTKKGEKHIGRLLREGAVSRAFLFTLVWNKYVCECKTEKEKQMLFVIIWAHLFKEFYPSIADFVKEVNSWFEKEIIVEQM